MQRSFTVLILLAFLVLGCTSKKSTEKEVSPAWKAKLETSINEFGHRNWILVVDKAFPALNSPTIEVVYADVDMQTALDETIILLHNAAHLKPIIYIDKEFAYITENELKGITDLRNRVHAPIQPFSPKQLYHDEVFGMVKETSSIFKVLVVKTKEITPYSSVFIELDCKYWNDEQEEALRKTMHPAK